MLEDTVTGLTRDAPNITWPALLAHWTAIAQASAAMPEGPAGDRFRAAVPSIIALHALACALDHLDQVSPDDRPAAIDKAAHSIGRHAPMLTAIYAGDLSPLLIELITDAQAALQRARARYGRAP